MSDGDGAHADGGVRVDAAALVARSRAASGPDGRLPTPDLATWPTFPFEGELLVRPLDDVEPEPPRAGESAPDCRVCSAPDGGAVWTGDRWRLDLPAEPMPVPGFLLVPRAHLDLADLDEAMAAELGVLTVRIARVLEAVPGVARVHVNRWGDGGAHLHVWFLARPAGVLQLRGSCLAEWLDILPALPPEDVDAVARHLAAELSRSHVS